MFATLNDFLTVWEQEGAATQKILDALNDDSLSQAVTEEDRTLGRMGWHLVTSLHEVLSRTGLRFDAPHDETEEAVPAAAEELAASYRQANAAMMTAMREQWTDATLDQVVDMYGEMWANRATLQMLLFHQIHHRAQMTVLMRQAGLSVPGIYGPSREEWAAVGMAAPQV